MDIEQLKVQLQKGLVYKGWVAAPLSDAWLLEKYGVTLGEWNGKGWNNCHLPHSALRNLNKHSGSWFWEVIPWTLLN